MIWIDKPARMPAARDADEHGNILVYHQLCGAALDRPENIIRYGTFITHWAKLNAPQEPNDGGIQWIGKYARLPAPHDISQSNCILAWDSRQGARMLDHRLLYSEYSSSITYWARIPERPRERPENQQH